MWKLFVGFIVFAALALYILTKSGGDIDMGGEKHDVAAPHSEVPASAPVAAAAASEALPAASAAASAASM